MEQLPEDCIGHIFSFASPLEAGRMSLVSRASQTTMNSDTTWEKFLPYDHKEIISRLVYPIEFSSKKELFYKLCNPHLIDKGTKMFWLDKRSGKKSYILGARELSIAGSCDPLQWSWKPSTGSWFAETAELRATWWLEIQGTIKTSSLSPKTIYKVYLILHVTNRAFGLHKLPSETTIEIDKHIVQKTSMYLSKHYVENRTGRTERARDSSGRVQYFMFGSSDEEGQGGGYKQIGKRGNGMIEIEFGKFYNNGDVDEEVVMSLREVKGVHLKGGIIVEGIEIRPHN